MPKYKDYEVNGVQLRFELSNHSWWVFRSTQRIMRLSEAKGKAIMKFLDDVKEVQKNDTDFKE